MTDTGLGLLVTNAPPLRQRRQRTNFTAESLKLLEQLFEKNPYPDINERETMAREFNTTEDRIQVWFQNKRARYRKKNLGKSEETKTRKGKKATTNLVSTPVAVKSCQKSLAHSTSTSFNDSAYASFSSSSSSFHSPSISPQYPIYSYYGSTPNYVYCAPPKPTTISDTTYYTYQYTPLQMSSPLINQTPTNYSEFKSSKPLFRPYE